MVLMSTDLIQNIETQENNENSNLRNGQSTPKYQQQRHKAIEAAASVFAAKGYHGASTKDIAAHLAIRQGSLYYYFKSKETALEEVCLTALKHYLEKMEGIFHQEISFSQKLSAVIQAHLSGYREDNKSLKVHNEQRLYLPEKKREKLKSLGSSYRVQLEQMFEEGVNSRQFREDLDCHFAALSLIGLCNYWGSLLSRDINLNLDNTVKQCTELTLQGCSSHKSSIHTTKH